MNTKPHLILISLLCFVLVSTIAQDPPKKCRKATTDSKILIGTLKPKGKGAIEIVGQATYTITMLYYDDSFYGTLTYVLTEDARQKIGQVLGQPIHNIPETLSKSGINAQVNKHTSCPKLQFDFLAIHAEVAGVEIRFKPFSLQLEENDDRPVKMLCTIARRIQMGRPIHRYHPINELLNCEEDDN
jgi:hypothetical protein